MGLEGGVGLRVGLRGVGGFVLFFGHTVQSKQFLIQEGWG